MIFETDLPEPGPLRAAISAAYREDEGAVVERLAALAAHDNAARGRIEARARGLVEALRAGRAGEGSIDSFVREYELSSREGVVLMCLAEALLRIPDDETADRLIRDKIAAADWESHLGHSDSLFVNASTWGLMLTGRVIELGEFSGAAAGSAFGRLISRSGEPVIRRAVRQAMRILGRQFVLGRTIDEALDRARTAEARGYRYSFDMLGEAAHTARDARRYFESYDNAITAIGRAARGGDEHERASISVKLSALHPRYEIAQGGRAVPELTALLSALAIHARAAGIGLTVDAEEADRLDMHLDILERVSGDERLAGWGGFGIAVQAYQKRALPVIDWLADLARRHGRRLNVRLVKGAYWDTEIKLAQVEGLDGYPVFTRKASTDVSYIACARRLFEVADAIYPQFATHNALTLSTVLELAGESRAFEFQRLHGMGEALYDRIVGEDGAGVTCRIYAPTGSHEDLLPYLVRRLLENGANTSFVNRIVDEGLPVEAIVADPVEKVRGLDAKPHPRIPLPADMFGAERKIASGVALADPAALVPLARAMAAASGPWSAGPLIAGDTAACGGVAVHDPADRRRQIGTAIEATGADVDAALAAAVPAARRWDATPAAERAACLERMAGLMEAHMAELMAMCTREAGKTIRDGVAEVREAVDFCRYYAVRARAEFSEPLVLPGPTGEANSIALHGRGVIACISPWNFPLAIYCGQIAAVLAAGNAVISKPAEQTPLIAARAIGLLHEAGVPRDVLQFLPGRGEVVGAQLVADPRIAGVAFTGSTETARLINRALAARDGPIVPLIAETGGQNVMIVDSSALAEQVVTDVVTSSFQSAGQRCSALRVMFLQEDIAPHLIEMLTGAMEELVVGDPAFLRTDVGPVIDAEAQSTLGAHAARMKREAKLLFETLLGPGTEHGTFFAPSAFEIDGLDRLEREVFGPVLHVIRYSADRIDQVIEAIGATGYGLTFGMHSRIDDSIDHVLDRLHVGNAYVNRNMIGAVVGVQPFGGEGLSGTGPKAGGPRYLHRFATERVVSVNTTAQGGNATLLSLEEAG
jgi:RHH-type proline utilization regulon transcriptional repressor/proline dehydrogenase/delta 1-pyrroline-5-carboxylate dehydrogenase